MRKMFLRAGLPLLVLAFLGCTRPAANPLIGRTFVQPSGPGHASYHFVSEDDVFIHYDVPEWTLDDGKPLPTTKPFIHASFDADNRAFYGVVDWTHPEGSSVDDAATWVYMMMFDPDYTAITGGGISGYDIDGKYLRHDAYGDVLQYSLETDRESKGQPPRNK